MLDPATASVAVIFALAHVILFMPDQSTVKTFKAAVILGLTASLIIWLPHALAIEALNKLYQGLGVLHAGLVHALLFFLFVVFVVQADYVTVKQHQVIEARLICLTVFYFKYTCLCYPIMFLSLWYVCGQKFRDYVISTFKSIWEQAKLYAPAHVIVGSAVLTRLMFTITTDLEGSGGSCRRTTYHTTNRGPTNSIFGSPVRLRPLNADMLKPLSALQRPPNYFNTSRAAAELAVPLGSTLAKETAKELLEKVTKAGVPPDSQLASGIRYSFNAAAKTTAMLLMDQVTDAVPKVPYKLLAGGTAARLSVPSIMLQKVVPAEIASAYSKLPNSYVKCHVKAVPSIVTS